MKYASLSNYTHYSLQYGFSKPKELINSCVERGYEACGIADQNSISGAVKFFSECKKKNIKPVIGVSLGGDKLFALNKDGWLDLIQFMSENNTDVLSKGNLALLDKSKTNLFDKVPKNLHFEFDGVESFYNVKSDAELHRICLASSLKTTLPDIQKHNEWNTYKHFFSSDTYNFGQEASTNEKRIIELCEDYSILEKPMLPKYPTPNGESEEEYLKQLCRKGWVENLARLNKVDTPEKEKEYLDRFHYEFNILVEAKLCGYFLIVWDILNFVRSQGWLPGPGRGCFLPNTKVKMADGTMKSISNISIGEQVIDSNRNIQTVEDILEYDINEDIIELEMEDGKIIRCTKDHKFLTNNRGWVEAQYLDENDDIKEI